MRLTCSSLTVRLGGEVGGVAVSGTWLSPPHADQAARSASWPSVAFLPRRGQLLRPSSFHYLSIGHLSCFSCSNCFRNSFSQQPFFGVCKLLQEWHVSVWMFPPLEEYPLTVPLTEAALALKLTLETVAVLCHTADQQQVLWSHFVSRTSPKCSTTALAANQSSTTISFRLTFPAMHTLFVLHNDIVIT